MARKKPTHVTVIRSTPDFVDMTIDGINAADVNVQILVEFGQKPKIEIEGHPVMYPTEWWVGDVLRYRDEGWLGR
jgi:hypothetical protein